ncbi:MAG TPA: PEP/pyruvate-binding domain-containing protein [Xanthomonadaceae bacterium]|nr:PEP/pyruvate-binding domain-containing protein [Xanthomonadaceae bacterium]
MTLLVTFPGASESPPSRVGGKASSLMRMAAAGFRVPSGAVLTTDFFAPWFAEVGGSIAWKAFLQSDPEQWPEHCAALKALVAVLAWTSAQRQALADLGECLSRRDGERFAVRSSAPDEDRPSASFAGGHTTLLGVPRHALEDAVRRCCASALDARVFAYKRECGLDVALPRMAVIVQRQLASAVAGIGFSLNPINNDYDEAVIDASWGLGEAVVSGRITPDHWVVDKVTRAIVERKAGAKQIEIVLAEDGGVRETESRASSELSLSDAQVAELTDLIVGIEALFARPMDIEWAYANDALHVLQARPITRYVPLPRELTTAPGERRRLYTDAALSKGLTTNAPVSVLGLDILERGFTTIIEAWTGRSRRQPAPGEAMFLFAGARMYMNLSPLLWIASPRMLARSSAPTDMLMSKILGSVDRKRYRSARRPQWLGLRLLWIVPRFMWGVRGLLWQLLTTLIAPERAYRAYQRKVASVERALRDLEREDLSLDELQRRSGAIFSAAVGTLMAALVVGQLSPRSLVRRTSAEECALADRIERGVPGNVVVEMGIALYRLAGLVERSEFDDLQDLAERIERRRMPEAFLQAWDDFVSRYGCRGPQEMDLASPRYGDDPRLMLQQMAQLVVAGALDPEALHRQHVVERQQAYLALLGRFGPLRRALLRRIYRRNELFAGSRDTPKYLNLLGYHLARRRALAEGRRLVERGRLDAPGHIFDLKIEDIDRALDDPSLDLGSLCEARARFTRTLLSHVRTFPPVIDSRGRILRPPALDDIPGLLRGMPVSSGVARGPVKVLRRADEKRVEKGDVLVAYTTDPGWTPLFVNAAAVVLEVGGVLQHGAVVAREYGKPCVIGIDRVMERLRDGAIVEVDGTTGTVRIEER